LKTYWKNASILFALIDNLEEISFAFRYTVSSDGELDNQHIQAKALFRDLT
jgi:hypothetical protein